MPRIIPQMTSTVIKSYPDQDCENGQKPAAKVDACLKDKPFQLSKPLVVSMSLFGLLFLNCKNRKWSRITRVYSLFVVLLFWVSFIQLFFAYRDEHFGAESFFKVVVHLWYLHNCVNALVTYKACNNENHFVEFLLRWSRLLSTNRGISPLDTTFSTSNYERRVKRRFILFLTIGWIATFVNIGYNNYFLFNTNHMEFAIAPVSSGHSFVVPMRVISAVVQVYMSAAWVFTLLMFMMMSSVIYREFQTFHDDFCQAISPEGHIAELEWFRRRHEDICQMVDSADNVLSAFNAAGILFPTCVAMLLLYSVVASPSIRADPSLIVAYSFWLGVSCFYLVLISYGGGYLNHMAHAPLKALHKIQAKEASPEFSLQMTMFLNKLTGEAIGLTALNMFVIDKPTILTVSDKLQDKLAAKTARAVSEYAISSLKEFKIAGAFITYFIVLIQFQQPSSALGSSVCNCTGL